MHSPALTRPHFSQAELEKIAAIFPEARVVIRIAVDDSKSVCRFNSKFGAAEHEWPSLLRRASELGLDVYGVSFHVGSGCQDSGPFGEWKKRGNKAPHYGLFFSSCMYHTMLFFTTMPHFVSVKC